MKTPDVVVQGKDNGEGMIIRYETAKGTKVFGLAMPNLRPGTDWDLGPTWCYLILGQKTVLIDVGRFGSLDVLANMLKLVGKQLSDIEVVVVTHSHEDHDGNLAEVVSAVQPELWAHSIYRPMISYHPHIVDGASHPELPGSCRHCAMSENFRSNCLPYQQQRSALRVDFAIDGKKMPPVDDLRFVFTPGHSPDSICIILQDEVIFTGDTILPDITPHPTRAYLFETNRHILPEEYRQENEVYGLMNYIKSLKRIASLDSPSFQGVFPSHRLFYDRRFNFVSRVSARAREIIEFHIDRCRSILKIVEYKPLGVDDIVIEHFLPSQLKGSGKLMARNEIMAHIEVMEQCGDICWNGERKDLVQRTGTNRYLDTMGAYLE